MIFVKKTLSIINLAVKGGVNWEMMRWRFFARWIRGIKKSPKGLGDFSDCVQKLIWQVQQ